MLRKIKYGQHLGPKEQLKSKREYDVREWLPEERLRKVVESRS